MEIEKLLENEGFKNKLAAVESVEELASLLNAEGIEINADELDALLNPKEGELAELELDMVAGGRSAPYWIRRIIPFLPPRTLPRIPFRR